MKEPIFDIKRDIKRLAVVIAIIIIPLMYSYFYLDAFWDPYSKLQNLPVAVVNEDKGATINNEKRNAGNELLDELKDNDELKWVFTSKTEAEDGLKDRKYYAIVAIPENFSANIATADKEDKVQGVIIFQPEQKRNFLASQILSKAILQLENKVSGNITKELVQTIADENGSLPDQLKELGDGLDKMQKEGISKIEDGLNTLISNQVKFNNGIDSLGSALNKASNGANTLYGSSNMFAAKQQEFANALSAGIPKFNQLSDGSSLYQKKIVEYDSKIQVLNGACTQLNSKLPALKSGIDQYNQGLKTYTQGLKAFGQGLAPLAKELEPLKTGATQYYNSVSTYSEKVGALDKGVTEYVGGVKALTGANKNAADLLTAYLKEHPEAINDKNIQSIVGIFQKSQGSIDQLNASSDKIKTSVTALSTGSQQLVAGSKQINDGVTKFVNGAPQLSQAAAQLAEGTNTLVTGGGTLSSGLDQLSAGLPQIVDGITKAASAATQLKDGYAQLDAGVQEAYGKTKFAASSAGLLADGAKKLNSGTLELTNGIGKINSGSKELGSNAQKFLDGEKELRDGAGELDDKVKEAYNKVADKQNEAIDKVAKLEGMAEFASDPVKVDQKEVDYVPDYGTAFAPYFISLSLWVGALIMFVMIYLNPQMRFKRKLVKNMHMDVKFLIYPLIGVVQAVALALVLINALNLHLTNTFMFFVVIVLVSLSFISIVQFLIVHLGDVGKFLVILLLILQLTASGGTFPNELVPEFFNVINPYMPMTYAIYALKETISGHNTGFLNQNIAVLAVIMVIFLVASLLLTGRKKAKSIDDIESEFVHNRETQSLEA
ncbi:MAG: hypothetical protein K0R50_3699 [Eubacterium sp.]|jgi:putative membrane protein|nr:hypothetical protein [Eubacterium sp.]